MDDKVIYFRNNGNIEIVDQIIDPNEIEDVAEIVADKFDTNTFAEDFTTATNGSITYVSDYATKAYVDERITTAIENVKKIIANGICVLNSGKYAEREFEAISDEEFNRILKI